MGGLSAALLAKEMRPGCASPSRDRCCCVELGVLDDEIVGESEVHDRLGGDFDVAIARGSGQQGARAGAGCATDGQANTTRCDTADDHAGSGHTADEGSGTLAFALLGADVIVSVESVLIAIERHGSEA